MLAGLAIFTTAGLALAPRADAAVARPFTWEPAQLARGVVDLSGPRSDGRFVAAVEEGLSLFGRGGLTPFAFPAGPGAYSPAASEPYIAVTPEQRLRKAGCSFRRNEVYAIAHDPTRVVRISRRGFASTFAAVPGPFLSGIAYDSVGTFGHRLLVTSTPPEPTSGQTTLYAIDCRGRVSQVVSGAPLVEGGIEVAPRGFGRFAGQLIGADEISGRVVAFKRGGHWGLLPTAGGIPVGKEFGVESVGFVPPRLGKKGAAFLSDQGDGVILRVGAGALGRAHVRAGDLLVATEQGVRTIAIRCRPGHRCGVRFVGTGRDLAHGEGHIVFRPAGR
jgi:hypothetical protein